MELVVISHLHIGVVGSPSIEGAHDTHIVEAVLLGENQGSTVQGEEIVTVAVALDILGTAIGQQSDALGLGLFGLGFRTPVKGGIIPVAGTGELEAAGRTGLAKVNQAGEGFALLLVVVQILVYLLERPGTYGSAGTDNPYVIVEGNVLHHGSIRSEYRRNNVGFLGSGADGGLLVSSHTGAELEIDGHGLFCRTSEGVDQRIQVRLLDGNGTQTLFININGGRYLNLVRHIGGGGGIELVGCSYSKLEVGRGKSGNNLLAVLVQNHVGDFAQGLNRHGSRIIDHLDVFLLAGNCKKSGQGNKRSI